MWGVSKTVRHGRHPGSPQVHHGFARDRATDCARNCCGIGALFNVRGHIVCAYLMCRGTWHGLRHGSGMDCATVTQPVLNPESQEDLNLLERFSASKETYTKVPANFCNGIVGACMKEATMCLGTVASATGGQHDVKLAQEHNEHAV